MNPIRIAVVGVGSLGQHHARILAGMEGVQLVGVVDPNTKQAETIAAKHNCKAYTTAQSLKGEIDAVSIVTPTKFHCSTAVEFLAAGVPCMVEKPLAGTVPEAKLIVNAAKRAKTLLQVGHIERFNPGFTIVENSTLRPKYIAEEKSVMKKAVAEKIYEVLEPTLKAKSYDLALSLRSASDGQQLTGVGALRVVNGKKIEELIKGLIVEMKEQERQAIQVDAEKVGDVNIHIINIPAEDKAAKDLTEAFGAARITLAFHNDAIVIGLGKNSTDEVKRVLAGISQGGSANPPPMQLLVHVKPLSKFVKDAAARKAFETIFTTPGSDELKFTVTGGDQVRWKLDVSTHFLKLIDAAERAKGE